MCFGHETPRSRLVFAHQGPITHEQVVHSSSGNLFVLHKGGSGKSLIVLFHGEPERDSPLHYATVVEAQSSAVGAQGIEVRAELQKGSSDDNW
jgi:hypothetical protein